jgi:hypothetical protein
MCGWEGVELIRIEIDGSAWFVFTSITRALEVELAVMYDRNVCKQVVL